MDEAARRRTASDRTGDDCPVDRHGRVVRHGPVTLPNLISLARILLVPCIVVALVWQWYWIALAGVLIAGLSDALDGFIARRFRQESALGRHLDPVADKLLVGALAVVLAVDGMIPVWIAALILGRDILLMAGSAVTWMVGRSLVIRPHRISKLNTVAQIGLVVWALASKILDLDAPGATLLWSLAVAGLTLASGAIYILAWLQQNTGAVDAPAPGRERP